MQLPRDGASLSGASPILCWKRRRALPFIGLP
jgi:hypothetical protein